MNRFKITLIALFLFTIGVYVVPIESEIRSILELVMFQTFSMLVVGMGIYSLSVFGFKGFRAMTLLLITSGILMWSIGDLIWSYDQYIRGEIGFPSAADYFYLLGYPMIFWAAISEAIGSRLSLKKVSRSTLSAIVLAALLLVAVFAYLGIYNIYDPEAPGGENLVLLGYGVGDIFLVVASLVVVVMASYFGNSVVGKFWRGMMAGVGATLIADIFYGIFTGPYIDGVVMYSVGIDGLYILGYIFMASALWNMSRATKVIQNRLGVGKK